MWVLLGRRCIFPAYPCSLSPTLTSDSHSLIVHAHIHANLVNALCAFILSRLDLTDLGLLISSERDVAYTALTVDAISSASCTPSPFQSRFVRYWSFLSMDLVA